MSDAVLAAIITGAMSLTGSIVTIVLTIRKQQSDMDKKISLMEQNMDEMKEDIRSHNNYAKMFAENIPAIKQHMTDVDRRLENLERRT